MKIKLLAVALFATVGLIPNSQAGNRHNNNGGNAVVGRSGAVRSGPSFSSVSGKSFGGNRMIYSGQRFSPRQFRPGPLNPQFGGGQFTGTRDSMGTNRISQFGNNHRLAGSGKGFASNNALAGNRLTGSGQLRNTNGLAPNWRNHVFAQRSGNWQRNWNRNADHWWHGHRCHFFNGSWVIFDVGFYPWGPWWWDYAYYGYNYGYGYPYGYNYGYDPNGFDGGYGYKSSQPEVYDT